MSNDETRVHRFSRTPQRGRGRAFLAVVAGHAVGQVHKLRPGEAVIGRADDADLRIVDDGVSRRHAKIVHEEDGTAKIIDLGSTNGTYVNGRRVEIEVLREGDRIRIGGSATLDLRYEGAEAEEEVEPAPRSLSTSNRNFYDEALESCKRTLKLREETYGPNHPAVAAILDTMAGTLRSLGKFDEAVSVHERAISIHEHRNGHAAPELAHLLTNLGETQLAAHRVRDALVTLEKALTLLEQRRASEAEIAEVRFAIARALKAAAREPVRAKTLAMLARDGFSEKPGGRGRALEVERWLATHAD